jgi:hypothetical protein
MPKTSRLFAFCASLLIGVGVLVGLPALALFEENFDNLELGGIANQGGWDNDSTAVVVDNQSNSPDQSLYLSSAGRRAKRTLSPAVSEGEINFYFRGDIDYYRNNPMRIMFYADGVFQFGGEFIDISSNSFSIRAYNKPTEVARVVNAREWYPVKIEFTATHYRISSGEDFGNWLNRDAITGDIDMIFFEAPATYRPVMWIDDIGGGAPPPISGYAPILTPTTPPRNTETIVDFDAGFEVAGTVQIPTSNSNIYTDLVLTFRAPDSFLPAETFVIDIGELTSGQSYNYSATTTVPITSSGDNFFKVGYTLLGSPYGGSFLNPPINEELLAFDNTWVKDSADDAPDYLITPSIKPDQPALEDCSAYSGADKIFCEFRNFVVGAFLPSDSALNQIGATMSALQNKFPVNYARAVGDTFSDISENVNDGATISFNLLGASGAVDTSIFTADLGAGITIGDTIKTIITFLVLAVFYSWAVQYMHRILR